jgi:hypothetical protein
MSSEELPREHHHHHHGDHHHHHHRRRHRHKRFHVPREAKGIGYWKFLGAPTHRSGQAGEAGVNTEDEAEESQETQGGSFWTLAVIVTCAIVLLWLLGEQILRVLWRIIPH